MTTIKDIAAAANVGTTTVSRVLNNSPRVTKETRQRVEAAMKALNYFPNEYARALSSNRSNTIAVSVPSIWHPFNAEFIYHIERALIGTNFRLLVSSNRDDPNQELEFIEMVRQNKVDGIIALTYQNIDSHLYANIPFVSIDRYFKENVAYVTSDNYHGGEIAAEELLRRGAKKLGYLAAIAPHKNETLKREDGFRDRASALGATTVSFLRPEPIQDYDAFFDAFFLQYPQVDGLFVMNDQTGLLLMDYLRRHHIEVPNTLQLIGYDGFRYFDGMDTPLTSIRQPIQSMAEASLRLLLDMINGTTHHKPIVLPVQFKEGRTTKQRMN